MNSYQRHFCWWLFSIGFGSGCFYDFSNPPDRIYLQCRDAAAGDACDDSNPCTENDTCDAAGICRGTVKQCGIPPAPECADDDTLYRVYQGIGVCRAADGVCEFSTHQYSCPDCQSACLEVCTAHECPTLGNGCLQGTCNPGPPVSCNYLPVIDDSECSVDEQAGLCRAGECGKLCSNDGECDDGNVCTNNICDDGACVIEFNTNDCNVCGICESGTCVFDESQHADCGDDITCGFCVGLGECGVELPGVACGTCKQCNGSGLCLLNAPAGLPGSNCDSEATTCSLADECDGTGGCNFRHLPDVPCDTCRVCGQTGECDAFVAEGDVGLGCDTAATSCTAAHACDGAGACVVAHFDLGTACDVCGGCDGLGVCTYDSSRNDDCGNTETCGWCTGLGQCSLAGGDVACDTCGRCNGGGDCAYSGSAHGDCGFCQRCAGLGQCEFQSFNQDIKGDCTAQPCRTCNGAGACGLVAANTQSSCATCQFCNSVGNCVNRPNDSQGPGCDSNCRFCLSGSCQGKEWVCPTASGWLCSPCVQQECNNCCEGTTCH